MSVIAIGGLTLFSYYSSSTFLVFYLIIDALLISVVSYLSYCQKQKKYKYKHVSAGLVTSIIFILNYSMFTKVGNMHFMEAIWMITVTLISFFILSNKWGIILSILNAFSYCYYFIFVFKDSLDIYVAGDMNSLYRNAMEITIATFVIAFVMIEYGKMNKKAFEYATEALDGLHKEKSLVEHKNKENTVLLQEIHHRVKNNLQVIVSLLRLQSYDLKTKEAKDSYQDTVNRILSMALIHQKLYDTESFVSIDLKDYFNSLIETLIATYSTENDIEFQVTTDVHSFSLNQLPSLGFIVNELVSNSLKHAFQHEGKIMLKLVKQEGNQVFMEYKDNGKWKTPSEDNSSFGSKLIDIFIEQLDGEYERTSDETGTTYNFTFKAIE